MQLSPSDPCSDDGVQPGEKCTVQPWPTSQHPTSPSTHLSVGAVSGRVPFGYCGPSHDAFMNGREGRGISGGGGGDDDGGVCVWVCVWVGGGIILQ